MDKAIDWNHMRAFLATAQGGSLSAAAQALGLTQPTLSRQIAALEAQLDLMLFERVGRGLQLTDAGAEMLTHVSAMGNAADRAAMAAVAQTRSVEGLVRVTVSEMMAIHYVPQALQRIRARAPRLRVEVVATDDISDLMRREADIAIRHVRPDQPDLVAKLIRQAYANFYATTAYLDRRTRPRTEADLAQHDFVSMGDAARTLPHMHALGLPVQIENFRFGATSGAVAWAMACAGLGLIAIEDRMANLVPQLEHVLPKRPPIEFPIWLATHREIHTSPRIRLVFDILAEVLAAPSLPQLTSEL